MGTIGAATLLFSWTDDSTKIVMKAWLLRTIFSVLVGVADICAATGLIWLTEPSTKAPKRDEVMTSGMMM
ncbi:MAG: hypothetical protein JW732_03835 [Dehalococcoidia bacterium]|nr:hypothetical protein [Dehalococcoidia bacterium]